MKLNQKCKKQLLYNQAILFINKILESHFKNE